MDCEIQTGPGKGPITMITRALLVCLCGASLALIGSAQDRIIRSDEGRGHQRLWYGSLAALLAGSTFDLASSVGKRELNPLIASGPNQQFNLGKGIAIKGAIIGGALMIHKLTRAANSKQADRLTSIGNFAAGAAFAAAGVHNMGIKPIPGR
jgi:hypothetical protein